MKLQVLTFLSAIAILSILIAVFLKTPSISEIRELTMPEQQVVEHPGEPDYQSEVEGIKVNTYCNRMPDDLEITCAAWHLQRVRELEEALAGN